MKSIAYISILLTKPVKYTYLYICEALKDHEGSVSIGGRLIINLRFSDDIVVNEEEEEEAVVLVDRLDTTTRTEVENGDRPRQDKSDDKQLK